MSKRMSKYKKLTIISALALGISALFYVVFTLAGADVKSRLLLLTGICIAVTIYFATGVIKLKKEGVLYDERDLLIADRASSISASIMQLVLLLIGVSTYTLKEININISGLMFLLFVVMWFLEIIIKFFVKRKI